MNALEFINGGELEAYFLGLLDPSAEKTILEMYATFPEVRQELHQLEIVMEQLAFAMAVEPAGDLEKAILDYIDQGKIAVLTRPPPVIDHSDFWLSAFRHLIPEDPADCLLFYPLTNHRRLKQSPGVYPGEHTR